MVLILKLFKLDLISADMAMCAACDVCPYAQQQTRAARTQVYQTGDLANMDGLQPELAAKLPTLLHIRNALYSQRFRSLVEHVTGLPAGTLTTKTDCSSNCYAHSGHLLCHDDVISTRRVSYIVYLTDPEVPWEAADGGALELYPLCERTPGACAAGKGISGSTQLPACFASGDQARHCPPQ